MSDRKVTRIVVDLYNANYIVLAMRRIIEMNKGVTRAMARILDWIYWDNLKTIKFAVKLKPFGTYSIKDNGAFVKFDNQPYAKYRAETHHVTCEEDFTREEENGVPLLNNEQFQLRLLDWAKDITRHFNAGFLITENPFQLIVSYVQDSDGDEDGTIFFLPHWELVLDKPWEEFGQGDKKALAQAVEYMANAIDDMYYRMGWLSLDEEKRLREQLRHLEADAAEADAVEEERAIASHRDDHDPAAVPAQVKPQAKAKKYGKTQGRNHRGNANKRECLPDPVKGSHLDIDRALKDWPTSDAERRAAQLVPMSAADTSFHLPA
jgi:hypothetical protein